MLYLKSSCLSLYNKLTWSKIETETALPPIVLVLTAHYGGKKTTIEADYKFKNLFLADWTWCGKGSLF